MTIRYLSICSGIEAFSVAVSGMDFEAVAFSEIDDFPSKVLAHHWPGVPNLGDFTKIDTPSLGIVDWLVGGPPCQSFSVAGLRGGLGDDRGNLTLEYVRLAHALQENSGLRGALFENVPGILSDKTNAFGCFLGAIIGADGPLYPGDKPRRGRSTDTWRWVKPRERVELVDDNGDPTGEFEQATEGHHRPKWPDAGMVAGPRARASWRVLDSQHFGVPQRRRRVFVVIDFGDGPDPAAVLFEPRGQVGGAETGGAPWEETAGTLASRSTGGGGLGTDMDLAGGLQVAHTLRGEGFDAGEDGSGRGTPLVVADYAGNAEGGNQDVPSLNASNGKKGINNQTGLVMVFDPNQITSKANRSQPEPEMSHTLPATSSPPVMFTSDVSPTLRAGGNNTGGDRPPGSDVDTVDSLVVYSLMPQNSGKDFKAREVEVAQPVMAAGPGGGNQGGDLVTQSAEVRRLLPVECEKLQGYPRNHTLIPGLSGWRDVGDDEDVAELEAIGLTIRRTAKSNKLRVNDPDGPRYKALGNSFTVNVIFWIMLRVRASMNGENPSAASANFMDGIRKIHTRKDVSNGNNI